MEEKGDRSVSSFTSAVTLDQMKVANVPRRYVLPPSQRPNSSLTSNSNTLPIIDLSSLHHPTLRSNIVDEVEKACKELGFFQVINHGISPLVLHDAMEAAVEFFNLPSEEKMQFASSNVHTPVRYGTSLNHFKDKVHFWRDFIKHYSHPISAWIDLWPSNPPTYREKMGNFARAMQELQMQLTKVVFEGLGLNPNYLQKDIEEGSQVMSVNCYPACPEPEIALGIPPHSDYGSLTIILQNHQGLNILDHENKWHSVPVIEGALIVQLGDQMEVLSNGRYKSVIHRAIVNAQNQRLSIACLHSLALNKKIGPAPELVDEQHPLSYKEGSFSDFLHYISGNDVTTESYINTLKKNP